MIKKQTVNNLSEWRKLEFLSILLFNHLLKCLTADEEKKYPKASAAQITANVKAYLSTRLGEIAQEEH